MSDINKKIEEALDNVAERVAKDGTGVFDTGDLASAGKLSDEQSNKFLELIHNEAVITPETRKVKMNAPKLLIEKLGFSSRILVGANSTYAAPSSTDVKVPGVEKVTLSTNEYAVFVDLAVDTLEDNIERGGLEDSIIGRVTKRLALDLEELFLLGDTTLNDGSVLDVDDGWFKKTTTNVVDNNAATFSEDAIFGEMLDALPTKYLRNPSEWRFYISRGIERAVRRERAARATAGGDVWLTSNAPLTYMGIPIVGVPIIKETSETLGNGLLCHPENLVTGWVRDISFHNFYNGRRRVWEMTWTLRVDMEFEYEDAVVKVIELAS